MRSLIPIYLFILLVMSVSQGVSQEAQYTLSANLGNPRITQGDVGALELSAVGGEPDTVPRSIDVPGLSITYTGSQFHQDQTVEKGQIKMTLTYTYYYTIQGTKIGDYVIPPVTTNIRGQSVTSNSVKVSIVKSKLQDITPTGNRFARLDIPEGNLYENQIFPIDATIYVAGRNSINGVSEPSLKHESFVIKRFSELDLGAVDLKGTVYSTAKLPTTMFALREGDHRLGPAKFNVKIYENSRVSVPSFFTQLQIRTIETDTVRVNILPLPSGAPLSFTGGVGAFEMESSATPLELKVGDPISMDFTITGTGNFETLGAPIVRDLDPEVWKTYEAKKDIQIESDGISSGRSVFTQVLIPLKEVSEIPAFELSYFDPKVEQYIKRRTIPTPIKVAPDNAPLMSPVTSSNQNGAGNFPTSAASIPVAQFPDILHIRRAPPKWKPYTANIQTGTLLGITNSIIGIGFAGLLGFGFFKKLKQYRAEKNTEVKALTFREAAHKVRPGVDRDDFYHYALEAFTIWENENPKAPADLLKLIGDLKRKCETALYSSDVDTSSKPISALAANEFIKVLKKLPSR